MNYITVMTRQLTKIKSNCRCISSNIVNYKENEKIKGNFTPVYKFPYIVPFSLINKLKMYQTALAVTSIPGMAILNQLNYVSSSSLEITAALAYGILLINDLILGISGCITLYGLGYLTNKFVGFIYYNEENDMVKIAYIDFWGKRRNIVVPAKDIIPLNELPIMPMDGLYRTIKRYSSKETLRLNLRLAIILDKEKIKKIL